MAGGRFPEQIAELTRADLSRYVDDGLRRATHYGLLTCPESFAYLRFGCVLGWDFHLQPEHAWIELALRDRQLGSPS